MSPTSRSQISNTKISNKNKCPDQVDKFPMSALSSQIRSMQINKSPISTTVSDQQQEEEEKIFMGNPDYAVMLPREIWFWIGKRLESRLDVSRFRSVCRTWRSVLPPPLRFPLMVPRPPGPRSIKAEGVSHFITEVTFYAANGMIVLFEEEGRGGQFSASALVHKDQIPDLKFELPSVSQISNLSFLCSAYHLHNAVPRYINNERVANKYNCAGDANVLKIAIVCSDGAAYTNPNYPRLHDLIVVAHLIDRKLAVLRLGGGAMNNNWETGFCDIAFDDIVNYRGQLYGVEKSGRAFVMDYNSLQMTQVAPAFYADLVAVFDALGMQGSGKLMHLAVVSGDLYVLVCTIPTRLYKLSLRLGKWVDADQELPDQVFIQDVQCNFAVPRNLVRGHDDNNRLLRFCSWPDFKFVRVAVGFNNTYKSRRLSRYCDVPFLPYRKIK